MTTVLWSLLREALRLFIPFVTAWLEDRAAPLPPVRAVDAPRGAAALRDRLYERLRAFEQGR